jgi:hypothetical protein
MTRVSDVSRFVPVFVGVGMECNTLSRFDTAAAATDALSGSLEFAAAREFATGEVSAHDAGPGGVGNPSLVGSVTDDLGDKGSVVEAVACVEAALAVGLSGRLGFLHMAPSVAAHALAARVIWRDGITWRTASGHVVVVSPGYEGVEQPGVTGPVWGTGEVYAATGSRETMTAVDRAVNTRETVTEDIALAAFDPCFVAVAGSGIECVAA